MPSKTDKNLKLTVSTTCTQGVLNSPFQGLSKYTPHTPPYETHSGHKGAAPSRGWVAGRLWNPPPLPPPRLVGWLARPRKTAKIPSAPLYRLFSCMVWVWGWVCKGGGGRPPFKNTLTLYSKLPCLRNLP